ncbi:nicotinamide riboside kinase 1 [Stomoxys calcitrans]|uniref:Phosphoribulokinase/uridine kinase domain-containing protein n=1 Tax=Stomoxys calcitrans TaxID=35570 RepID=A0A1I8PH93_STOCA|nr:nicotinamide riboside kinase 1 [Stomoxys calcitrans]
MPQWLVIGISGVTCGGKTTLAHNLRDYFLGQRNVPLWNTPYSINEVQLISQDDYFLPVDDLRHKWVEPLNAINFELITSLDMKQMLSDIMWTLKGRYLASDPMENVDYNNEMTLYSGNFEHFPAQRQQYNTGYVGQQHQTTHPDNTHNISSKPVHNKFAYHQNFSQMPHQSINNANQSHSTSHILRINSQMMAHLRDNKISILIIEGFMIFNQPELLTLCNIKFHFHLPYEKCFERRRKRTYDPPDVVGYFEMCVWPHYEKNFQEFRDRKDITILNGEIEKDKILKYVVKRILNYFEERCDVGCPPPHKLLGIPSCSNGNMTNSSLQTCPMEQQ